MSIDLSPIVLVVFVCLFEDFIFSSSLNCFHSVISNIPFFHSLHTASFPTPVNTAFPQFPLHPPFSSGLRVSSFVCIRCTIKIHCVVLPLENCLQVLCEIPPSQLEAEGVPEVRRQKPVLNTVPCFRMHLLHSGPDFDGEIQHCFYFPSGSTLGEQCNWLFQMGVSHQESMILFFEN